jgi:hypothetical protein
METASPKMTGEIAIEIKFQVHTKVNSYPDPISYTVQDEWIIILSTFCRAEHRRRFAWINANLLRFKHLTTKKSSQFNFYLSQKVFIQHWQPIMELMCMAKKIRTGKINTCKTQLHDSVDAWFSKAFFFPELLLILIDHTVNKII